MLIMCQSYCCSSYFMNQHRIFSLIFLADCPSFSLSVLMSGNSAQRITLLIQEESCFSIHIKFPNTKSGTYLITGTFHDHFRCI